MPQPIEHIRRAALAAIVALHTVALQPAAPSSAPEWTPVVRLRAQFLTKPRCPVYRRGNQIKVAMEMSGARIYDDALEWHVADYLGQRLDGGTLAVPKGE